VPLHSTSADKLREYLAERNQHVHSRVANTFFINDRGKPLRYSQVRKAVLQAQPQAGILKEEGPGHQGPVLHALRHSFAVGRLLSWYHAGANVRAQLPNLSVYLGHLGMVETYRYLSATPELLTVAGDMFSRYAEAEDRR
jgi:integrase